MSELLTPSRIYNMAMAQIGGTPVQNFNEDNPAARGPRDIYGERRAFCLGLYPWSFAKKTVQLTRLADVVSFHGYKYAYALPAERLGPPLQLSPTRYMPSVPFVDYDIHGTLAFADSETLFGLIRHLPDEHTWPPTFVSLVVCAIAAIGAIAQSADKTLASAKHAEAFGPPMAKYRGGLAGAAINADAYATPPKQLDPGGGPLVRAMRGY